MCVCVCNGVAGNGGVYIYNMCKLTDLFKKKSDSEKSRIPFYNLFEEVEEDPTTISPFLT